MKNLISSRKLRLESLEERALLAVTAGFEYAGAGAVPAGPTEAVKWVVNTTDDPADWSDTDNVVSLREAIARAGKGNVITFDSSLTGGTIALSHGELNITQGIKIDATSIGGITIDGGDYYRVFSVSGGTEYAPVSLTGLKITGENQDPNIFDYSICCQDSLVLTNCVVCGNMGGIYNTGLSSVLTLRNCTIAGNMAATDGLGVYTTNSATSRFFNSIVMGVAEAKGYGFSEGYNTLSDFTGWKNTGGKNIVYNPSSALFTNPAKNDYTLAYGSQAVNMGSNDYVNAEKDLLNNDRIVYDVVDLGAYEYNQAESVEAPSSVVTTAEDVINVFDNQISLREAAIYYANGGTVTFAESVRGGTIDLYSQIELSEAVTVDATSIGGVTIDGGGCDRVFSVSGGTNYAPVSLIGLKITGGSAADGGGVYSQDSLVLTNCVIFGNMAERGGGIYNTGLGSVLTLRNCTVAGNMAATDGLGVYTTNSATSRFYNSIVMGVSEAKGYGFSEGYNTLSDFTKWENIGGKNIVYNPSSALFTNPAKNDYTLAYGSQAVNMGSNDYVNAEKDLLNNDRIVYDVVDIGAYEYNRTDSVETPSSVVTTAEDVINVFDNQISLREAAIYYANGGTVTFAESVHGGTIDLYSQIELSEAVTIDATSIGGVTIDGGGCDRVFSVSGGTEYAPVSLVGLKITGGSAADGGGIYSQDSLVLTNCVVYGNMAERGGGIYNIDGNSILMLRNCTVAGNMAAVDGSGVYTTNSATSRFYNSIVMGVSEAKGYGFSEGYNTLSDFTGWKNTGGKNIVYDPSSALFTNPAKNDYTLAYGSQAVNMGSNDYVKVEKDLLNNDRIVYDVVDIGAYEYNQADSVETPSSVVTTAEDVINVFDNQISLREAAIYYANGGTVTFAESVRDGKIDLYSQIELSEAVTIDATSIGGVTIDGRGRDRVFSVSGGTEYAPVSLVGLKITGGSAADGGGIYSQDSLVLTNCVVYGNMAERGGGIYNIDGNSILTLKNCTVAGNTAETDGLGVYTTNSATSRFYNSIVMGVSEAKGYGFSEGYNTLSDFTEWKNTDGKNIVYDPSSALFTNPAKNDYTLAVVENSQAIDKGDKSYIAGYRADLAGNPRIVNRIVDLGAYECQNGIPELDAPAILTGNRGIYVSYGANRHQITWDEVENASGYELAYSADGSNWTTVSAEDTSAVITGLTYGADMQYRVRALGDGVSYTDSEWSAVKSFNVCPMDIDGDGDIAGGDRVLMVGAWLSGEGDDEFLYAADIDGDGDVTGADRAYLSNNWLLNVYDDADDLLYPPAKVSDAVFAQFASADLDADLGVF